MRFAGVARGFENDPHKQNWLVWGTHKKTGEWLFDRLPTLSDQVCY